MLLKSHCHVHTPFSSSSSLSSSSANSLLCDHVTMRLVCNNGISVCNSFPLHQVHTNSSVSRRPETPERPKHDEHYNASFARLKYTNIFYMKIMRPIGPQRHQQTVLTCETYSPDSQQLAPLFPPKSPKQ